jgi:hypothetical protein
MPSRRSRAEPEARSVGAHPRLGGADNTVGKRSDVLGQPAHERRELLGGQRAIDPAVLRGGLITNVTRRGESGLCDVARTGRRGRTSFADGQTFACAPARRHREWAAPGCLVALGQAPPWTGSLGRTWSAPSPVRVTSGQAQGEELVYGAAAGARRRLHSWIDVLGGDLLA